MTSALQRLLRLHSGRNDVMIEETALPLRAVYRRFDVESHALQFLEGEIFLSTIQRCRSTEDAIRGDVGEGTMDREIALAMPGMPHYDEALRQMGMDPAIHKDAVITNSFGWAGLRDGWLLCMSHSPIGREEFGKYVVKITQPVEFFAELTLQMFDHKVATQALAGRVCYGERKTLNGSPPLAPDPFVKPERFAPEDEFRFCWCHDDTITMVPSVFRFTGVRRFLSKA